MSAPKVPWLQRDELRAALLILAIALAYQPVWHAGTIWDDNAHMIGPELQSWHGLERVWFQPGATQQYYPVVYSVFWLEQKLWGDTPLGYHLVNVILHITSALLAVKLLRRLDLPGAWLGAALWALHPVQVESVAWISEMKNTLSGVCCISGALTYLQFDRERNRMFYWTSFGIFVVGLLAKTVIATLPAALLLMFWWKRKKLRWKEDVLPLLPFFAVGISLGLFTAHVERTYLIGTDIGEYDLSILERFLLAGRVICFYLRKLAWPHPLIFIYPRWEVNAAIWWQFLFPSAVLMLMAGLRRFGRRLGDGPFVALLFFSGTLFPALGFFNVYPFRFSFVADHFQYLASIGPLALAGAGITLALRPSEKRGSLPEIMVCATLLGTLGSLTWMQSRTYADVETLWNTTIQENPGCWMAHNNLGGALFQAGRTEEAIEQYEQALQLKPDYAEAHNNMGDALLQTGRVPEAIEQYEQALRIKPDYATAHNNLGDILSRTGRPSEAMKQLELALRIKPDYAEAHNNLGNALLQMGRGSEAIDQFKQALRSKPDASTYYNLGGALLQTGRAEEAIGQYEQALQLKPDYAEAHNNMGSALLQTGRVPEAISQYEQALQIKPNYADAHFNLGYILQQTGQFSEAREQFEQALRINPDLTPAREYLIKLQSLQKTAPTKK